MIDRWYSHPKYVDAVVDTIERGLAAYAPEVRDRVCIVFSAHSLPIRVVARGDQYPPEIAATAATVMQRLRTGANARPNAYIMAWQSQVGPLPWLGPQTGEVLAGLGAQGYKHVMSVPLGFTSDHIETLYEVDHTYAEVAKKAGIEHFSRAPSLNDSPLVMDAMAAVVAEHLDSGRAAATPQVSVFLFCLVVWTRGHPLLAFPLHALPCGCAMRRTSLCLHFPHTRTQRIASLLHTQYALNCPTCTNPDCRTILNPVAEYKNNRTAHGRAL